MITWVQFLDGLPLEIWEGKTVQNFSRFLTTLEFDREYLRKGSTNRNSENYKLINYNPAHVGWKKDREIWSTNEEVIDVHCILTHTSGHFSGNYILALKGCCALKFLHSLQTDQCYLAHTPWESPKNFCRENLKFGLKFSVCTSMTSRVIGISSQIFIQTTCRELQVIMWVQFSDGLPPKIWDGEKRSKFGAIFDNFRLWSRISPEWSHESKIEEVGLVDQAKKVGELWSTRNKVINVHINPPKWTLLGRLYFGPYGVMCPQFFIRARNCRRLANAHPNWEGVPPQKNDDEDLQFGLKFSVCAPITSGLVGTLSSNFSRPRDELWSTNEKVLVRILIDPNCLYTVSWSRKSIRHVVLFGVVR